MIFVVLGLCFAVPAKPFVTASGAIIALSRSFTDCSDPPQ
jgi:hypothetical protein